MMHFSIIISFIALSHAASLSSRDAEFLMPRDNTITAISEDLFENFKLFANFTAAAFCPNNEDSAGGSLITCSESICSLVEADNVTALVEIGGLNDTTTDDIAGYVAVNPVKSLVVVAFAGSTSLRNWIDDLAFVLVNYTVAGCEHCWVHSGFSSGWSQTRTAVLDAVETAMTEHPTYSVVVTGHSLGAAVATLATAELRSLEYIVDSYTFGSPRVGNDGFASFVTNQAPSLGQNYRMTHINDPIPQLPPTWIGYQHTSPEYWLSDGVYGTTDYNATDVVVCEGIGNDDCNAGTGLIPLDGYAHNYYLGAINACQGSFSF